jgi:hypothetical protein
MDTRANGVSVTVLEAIPFHMFGIEQTHVHRAKDLLFQILAWQVHLPHPCNQRNAPGR